MIARSFWAGALSGAVVGFADALVARAGAMAALHTAAILGLFAAVVAAAGAALVIAARRWTIVGPLLEHGLREHAARRERDPGEALVGLSLVLPGIPIVGGALVAAYLIGLETITKRHHKGLIVAVVIGLTLVALVGAAALTLFAGALVERGLKRLPRAWLAKALSSPLAPLLAALALLGTAAAVGCALSWKTLAQLALRPYVVALLVVAAFPLAWIPARRAFQKPLAHALLGGLLAAITLATGADPGVRKQAARTGLAGPLAEVLRRLTDFDLDRHGSILGGGDCAPFDPAIHPGAVDFPGDGIDQNCIGGDLRLGRRPEDVRFAAVPPQVPADFNVLLVTIDTLRADHVGAYGYGRATTPALDALAGEGFLFENAWAHAPSTRYSMPAILTGRYPSHVAFDTSVWWPAVRAENDTIAELLEARGFVTGAILNYHYFDRVRRMDQGFDTYDNANARLHVGNDPASTRGSSSRQQAEAARRWLDEHAGQRFFLWVHFYDPHYEYERHEGTEPFADDEQGRYDHEIRFTDDQIATVFQKVREQGIWDKTIVVVTGDHGEGFGEHGVKFHGYHLYAPQTKVPLIARVPGLTPKRVSMPVGHVDLLPTLANLAGGAAAATMEGQSLVAEMAGQSPADADRVVFQEVKFEGPTERYGLVSKCRHVLWERIPANTFEAYDLCADPTESKELGAIPDDLRAKLQGWVDALDIPLDAAAKLEAALLRDRPSPGTPLDADLGDGVRLLGVDLPAELKAGGEAPVTWYFEARDRVDGEWRVFVHVEGPGRFQGDHEPVDGAYPVARWQKGQLIADRQSLKVPPATRPGEYVVYAGLWSPKTRQNMPVAGAKNDGKNRVRVGTVKVIR